MIIEDINFVPYFIDPDSIIMIALSGKEQVNDLIEEKSYDQRINPALAVTFYLMFGISQTIILSKQQYDDLWKRVKDDLC